MDFNSILDTIGEFVSGLTAKALSYLANSGIIVSLVTAKIISLLLILLITYAILHFAASLKPIMKILIVIVAIILIVSIIATFV